LALFFFQYAFGVASIKLTQRELEAGETGGGLGSLEAQVLSAQNGAFVQRNGPFQHVD
jgi:hypothetical protein